eukprot:CAMPEP_0119554888 /NCGR_PEP_ID=MMETSP1352-20130426/7246_1 /TAXON_ID=265584 /ORGANISM="Stauroneis constricta, Strain CCMP1120" /LENGTH=1230 /DNA_ID=CAMNT_0007601551 /DNA_START=63 /DNA_END=3755 /DNA_ORIENTATION=+
MKTAMHMHARSVAQSSAVRDGMPTTRSAEHDHQHGSSTSTSTPTSSPTNNVHSIMRRRKTTASNSAAASAISNATATTAPLRQSASQDFMLSRSLGTTEVDLFPTNFQRHISSDLTKVSYSGYLLKRSNNPRPQSHEATAPHHDFVREIQQQQSVDNNHSNTNRNGQHHQHNDHDHEHEHEHEHDDDFFTMTDEHPAVASSNVPLQMQNGMSYQQHHIEQHHVYPQHSLPPPMPTMDDFVPNPSRSLSSQAAPSTATPPSTPPSRPNSHQNGNTTGPAPPKNPLESGIEFLAGFFGLRPHVDATTDSSHNDRAIEKTIITATDLPQSAPHMHAKASGSSSVSASTTTSASSIPIHDSFRPSYHKRQSAPIVIQSFNSDADNDTDTDRATPTNDAQTTASTTEEMRNPPMDYISPKDGHLWRAKYCILQDGILYFYRNPTDANSIEAVTERNEEHSMQERKQQKQKQPHYQQTADLSKSPMPRPKLFYDLQHDFSNTNNNGSNNAETNTTHMWEKRVYLDAVGAVRSAELEYGHFCFELVAVPNENNNDNNNKLVLQSRTMNEMNEWLFQFHRSLATLLFNMVTNQDLHSSFDPHQQQQQQPYARSFNTSFLLQRPSLSLQGHSKNNRFRSMMDAAANNENNNTTTTTTPPKTTTLIPPKQQQTYIPPHMRRKAPASNAKYVPPYLRNNNKTKKSFLSLAERAKLVDTTATTTEQDNNNTIPDKLDILDEPPLQKEKRGGCANPDVVHGSILDDEYKRSRSSKLKRTTEAYGCYGYQFEVGAASECGTVRSQNEDSYLIARLGDSTLFAVFDGHYGDEAARFAVEKLTYYIGLQESQQNDKNDNINENLQNAIIQMDDEFCRICSEDGRDWGSGATALIVILTEENNLIVSNLGDSRGVICRSVPGAIDSIWSELDVVIDDVGHRSSSAIGDDDISRRCVWKELANAHSPSRADEKQRIEEANGWIATETEIFVEQIRRMDLFDKDVIDILRRCLNNPLDGSASNQNGNNGTGSQNGSHGGSCNAASGGGLRGAAPHRITCISRVCSELAVSRALGDRDFKAQYNIRPNAASNGIKATTESGEVATNDNKNDDDDDDDDDDEPWWDCSIPLPYPEGHNRRFKGDLVSNTPESHQIEIGMTNVSEEFVILACDGLWDVMNADDAVRLTRDLLYRQKWTAKKAAARLAELAMHLGSSDNITVIVLRLFQGEDEKQSSYNKARSNSSGEQQKAP